MLHKAGPALVYENWYIADSDVEMVLFVRQLTIWECGVYAIDGLSRVNLQSHQLSIFSNALSRNLSQVNDILLQIKTGYLRKIVTGPIHVLFIYKLDSILTSLNN